MKLALEGPLWLVRVRWIACAGVFLATWLTSSLLGIVEHPLPLYLVGLGMVIYNLVFEYGQRTLLGEVKIERSFPSYM